MEKELYFSVIKINESFLEKKLNPKQISEALSRQYDDLVSLPIKRSDKFYLWALGGVLSGITDNQAEVIEIAKQNGLDANINFDPRNHYNARLREMANYDFKLISYQKRQTELYYFCVWGNHFQYLCGIEPIFQQDNITGAELNKLKTTWGDGDWAGYGFGSYIKEYIRKREAKRKLSTPKNSRNDAIFIDFLYSPQNTWYVPRKRWVWQRHRIVKKTKGFIFIEEFPYHGGSYLKTGWQAFIVYTIMIGRKELEQTNQFTHHSRRKVFYEKCAVPELKSFRFTVENNSPEDDCIYDDFVFEIPLNSVQWALNLLKIGEWPTTIDSIKRAFNIQSMRTHPDRGGDAKEFILCKKAMNELLDLVKK